MSQKLVLASRVNAVAGLICLIAGVIMAIVLAFSINSSSNASDPDLIYKIYGIPAIACFFFFGISVTIGNVLNSHVIAVMLSKRGNLQEGGDYLHM